MKHKFKHDTHTHTHRHRQTYSTHQHTNIHAYICRYLCLRSWSECLSVSTRYWLRLPALSVLKHILNCIVKAVPMCSITFWGHVALSSVNTHTHTQTHGGNCSCSCISSCICFCCCNRNRNLCWSPMQDTFSCLVLSCLRQTLTMTRTLAKAKAKAKANAIEKPFRIASMEPKQANMLPNSRGGELQQLQVGRVQSASAKSRNSGSSSSREMIPALCLHSFLLYAFKTALTAI